MKSTFRFALALFALVAIAPIAAQPSVTTPETFQIQIQQIQGDVMINRAGSRDFVKARINDIIARQDRLLLQRGKVQLLARRLQPLGVERAQSFWLDRAGMYNGIQLQDQVSRILRAQPRQTPRLARSLGTIGGATLGAGLATRTIRTSNSSKKPIQPVSP